jgi:hypothetical protein
MARRTKNRTRLAVLACILHTLGFGGNQLDALPFVLITNSKFDFCRRCVCPARFFSKQCLCAADRVASFVMNYPSSMEYGHLASETSRGLSSLVSLFHNKRRPHQLTRRPFRPTKLLSTISHRAMGFPLTFKRPPLILSTQHLACSDQVSLKKRSTLSETKSFSDRVLRRD